MGFYHHKITPLWPLADGMVDNFMISINKLVKTASIEGKRWTQELIKFLCNYRGTSHPTTTSFCFKEDRFVHDCLK